VRPASAPPGPSAIPTATRCGCTERWPCGEFCNQSERDDDGLGAWTAQDRPIEDTDIVLWYVFGIHHITRPEDWPVMPADTVSFWLKPAGFFDRNPALDV
jgi:primary-amine oxidase